MIGDRIAVIDLGSNTFHLLICEINEDGSWTEIHKEREYVKLAASGIHSIDEHSTQRAIDAMKRFVSLIEKYDVQKTKAIGTAALRESDNGKVIAGKLTSISGIEIEIVDGQKEAQYILMGIRSALPDSDQYGLIMDIGGGSVEFILYKHDEVAFVNSYKIGVAILYQMFHKSDPISPSEIQDLEEYIEGEVTPLLDVLRKLPNYHLVGASGSFEVLNEVLPKKQVFTHWAELEIPTKEALDRVIRASIEERRSMPEIPDERLDYIVVAYLLIRFFILSVPPQKLFYCEYALKEGAVAEMIAQNNI